MGRTSSLYIDALPISWTAFSKMPSQLTFLSSSRQRSILLSTSEPLRV